MMYRKNYVYGYEQGAKFSFDRHIKELDTVNVFGITVNVPQNVEEFLEHRYGKNWRIPTKKKY